MNQEVSNYIDNASDIHKEVLSELRKLILSIAPAAKEQFKWSRPVYGLAKDFCYLQTTKKYITLGFFDFEKISTNKKLIEGTGKSMRHVKLTRVEDIQDFNIEAMIKEVLS